MKKIFMVTGLLLVILLPGLVKAEDWGNDTLRVIHNRKSVRAYQDRMLSRAQLELLMAAGMASPTAGDKRPWSFVAISDRKTLRNLSSELKYAGQLTKAGGAIVVCGIPEKSFPGEARAFWIQDCSAVSENILLAAESLKLGGCWIGIYPLPERVAKVRQILKIPGNVVPLNVISLGYPLGGEKPKNKWNPENIHWNKW